MGDQSREQWNSLTAMAETASRSGKYEEAKTHYRQAMADADSRQDAHNAYYTRCSLAGLLRLLDDYAASEELLRFAVRLRHFFPQELAREPVSPLTDLERILVKQNRLAELQQILEEDAEKMASVYGTESFEYKMSLMALAKAYGKHFKNLAKCKELFREVLNWSRSAEPITRKMMYMEYDGVLRGAGLTAEAEAAQAELEALKNGFI